MKSKIAALADLPREERRILRRAWFSLLLVEVGLRYSSLPNVQRLLERWLRLIPKSMIEAIQPFNLERLVDIAARHHICPTACLQRSLVLQGLLQRQGLSTDLRIGVRRQANHLRAHAWLESAGRPLFESPNVNADFPPLLRLSEAS